MKDGFKVIIIVFFIITIVFAFRILKNEDDQEGIGIYDLEGLSVYKSLYVGDARNTTQLFNNLLLSENNKTFEIDSELFIVTINFDKDIEKTDEKLLKKAVIYNSVIAFSLIENLEIVKYDFVYGMYNLKRSEVESWFDFELNEFYINEEHLKELMKKIDAEEFNVPFIKKLKYDNK